MSLGLNIYTENVSVKGWTKFFGRSIGWFAPSALVSTIRRKAENAGGKVVLINTWTAKLSQYNHADDTYQKKHLGERTMVIDGQIVQRDLYSAFLAFCMNEDLKTVNRNAAEMLWSTGARVRLGAVFDFVKLTVKGRAYCPASTGV